MSIDNGTLVDALPAYAKPWITTICDALVPNTLIPPPPPLGVVSVTAFPMIFRPLPETFIPEAWGLDWTRIVSPSVAASMAGCIAVKWPVLLTTHVR
ncbi:MAG: hypothetical protein R3F56_10765 [Planctomycetota bacterium]